MSNTISTQQDDHKQSLLNPDDHEQSLLSPDDHKQRFLDPKRLSLVETEMQEYKKQDELLDQLGGTFGNLKEIAIEMGEQLDEHKEIIDELEVDVDNTSENIQKVTRKISRAQRREDICVGILCFLFVALIVTAVTAFVMYVRELQHF